MITIVYLSMSLYSFDGRIHQVDGFRVNFQTSIRFADRGYKIATGYVQSQRSWDCKIAQGYGGLCITNRRLVIKLSKTMYRVDVVDPVKLTRNPLSTHNCTINTGFESSSYLHKSIAL